jgi:predicted transcriptional regulator YheO
MAVGDKRDEERRILEILKAVTAGLERVVGSNVEVIVHDMRRPEHSTVAIANGHVTGRRVGDPIIAAPLEDKGFKEVLDNARPTGQSSGIAVTDRYVSRTRDGRELHSMSVILRDARGQPFASLCANVDLTPLQLIGGAVGTLMGAPLPGRPPGPAPEKSIDELIDEIVADAVSEIGRPVVAMDREDRIRVVRIMSERGLFLIKSSVERVARVLGVTRYTVYNYLGRGDGGGASVKAAPPPKTGKAGTAAKGTKSAEPAKATRAVPSARVATVRRPPR